MYELLLYSIPKHLCHHFLEIGTKEKYYKYDHNRKRLGITHRHRWNYTPQLRTEQTTKTEKPTETSQQTSRVSKRLS